jgi:hypothetical protein
MHNDTGLDGTFNSTYQKLYFDTAGLLNGFSFANSTLTLIDDSGIYRIEWKAEGVGTNNHEYHGYVFINEIQQNNTIGHAVGSSNNEVKMIGLGRARLNKYDNITVRLADLTASGAGTQIDANIILDRVGN